MLIGLVPVLPPFKLDTLTDASGCGPGIPTKVIINETPSSKVVPAACVAFISEFLRQFLNKDSSSSTGVLEGISGEFSCKI